MSSAVTNAKKRKGPDVKAEDDTESSEAKRRTSEDQHDADAHIIDDPTVVESSSSNTKMSGNVTKPSLRASGGSGTKPVKKLLIKNISAGPKLPENFKEDTWTKLKTAVQAILQHEAVQSSLEELFQAVDDMVLHKFGEFLYSNLESHMADHLRSLRTKLTPEMSKGNGFLSVINKAWSQYCDQLLLIRNLFLSLDRKFTIANAGVKSVWDLGLHLFKEAVAATPDIQRRVLHGLLSSIEKDRSGETVDKPLLRNLSRMYIALGMYHESFETPFIESSDNFYTKEFGALIQTLDVPQYMERVEKRTAEEDERLSSYLDTSTRKSLMSTLDRCGVLAHVDVIIGKGLEPLLDENRNKDIQRMFALLGRVGALKSMRQAWLDYIKRRGGALVLVDTGAEKKAVDAAEKEKLKAEREKARDSIIDSVLKFKVRLDETLSTALQKSDDFYEALKDGFEKFLNINAKESAELLARFIHKKLQSKDLGSDQEMDIFFDRVVHIFRCLTQKADFETYYRVHLGKRLLLGRLGNLDAERTVIEKLKSECGPSFTSSVEKMFGDVENSDVLSNKFRQEYSDQLRADGLSTDVKVFALTQGIWPPQVDIIVKNLPGEFVRYQELFEKFYTAAHNARKLQWIHHLGQCILKVKFEKRTHELIMSMLQAAVLMLFEGSGSLTFQEVRTQLGIEEKQSEYLLRTIQSLTSGNAKVLKKEPAGKEVAKTDSFSFASGFTGKKVRLKINQLQMKETKEEQDKTEENIATSHRGYIDAAIVRVMKTRKTLPHNVLFSEVIAQLRFKCTPADIKKRIEGLIEQEYIRRDENDPQLYHYVA